MKVFWIVFLFTISTEAMSQTSEIRPKEKPSMVIGIIVDQMRYDYISRFWDHYSDNGFKRLLREGFNFKNNHFNYAATYTGPGHASVWTGTSPSYHGIIGNNWFDKSSGKPVYCAGDSLVNPVGTKSSAGKMSPHRLKSTTIGDENRLHTQMRGKTIGIALKDRGAILSAGHTANAAYWFHGEDEGKWITSTFYMEDLPQWVMDFNNSGIADSYFKTWSTLNDIGSYIESGPDLSSFEGGFKGKEMPVFPYDLNYLKEGNGGYDFLQTVAFGNDFTTDFAIAAIKAEELGKDQYTDFLTVSYSSPDYIGHNFGINSKEIQDTYIRLDLNIAELLSELDQHVGEGNYLLFLTADHGVAHVPSYLQSLNIPAGNFNTSKFIQKMNTAVENKYKRQDLIKNISNNQIFINYDVLEEMNIDFNYFETWMAKLVLKEEQVDKVFTRSQMENNIYKHGIFASIQNSFHQKRSGDILYVLDPGSIPTARKTGTTHGSGHVYDTHAPLIFFGKGIKSGSSSVRTEIIDIAPTISTILNIPFPNSSTGNPLSIIIDN